MTEKQRRYEEIIKKELEMRNIRVVKWRKSMSGRAWRIWYMNGGISNLVQIPRPRTPISVSICFHEIGHHHIGFRGFKYRCLEEWYAWSFAVHKMKEYGIELDVRTKRRIVLSLRYAIAKSIRRGIKGIPVQFVPFLPNVPKPVDNLELTALIAHL